MIKEALKRHIQSIRQSLRYVCAYKNCRKQFKKNVHLQNHMWPHIRPEEWKLKLEDMFDYKILEQLVNEELKLLTFAFKLVSVY